MGSRIARLTVRHVDELEAVVAEHQVAIGVIATPAGSAQGVCTGSSSAGVTSILNFAPLVLSVPEGVDVRKVDLSIELQILAFHAQRRSASGPGTVNGLRRRGSGAAGAAGTDGQGVGGEPVSVLVVGLSHKSAPVATLEQAAVTGDALAKLLRDITLAESVAETFVISTCNRVEVYADVDRFHAGVTAICELLARHCGVHGRDLTPYLYVHYQDSAVSHLLTVACGLDSVVVGEDQILGQVRSALKLAAEQGTLGPGPRRARPAGPAGRQAGPRRDRDRPGGPQPGERRGRAAPPPASARRRARPRSPGARCSSSAPAR